MLIGRMSGVDLLRTAGRVAAAQGNLTVSMYLVKAAAEHQRIGQCPSDPTPCMYEIEAARVLMSGS